MRYLLVWGEDGTEVEDLDDHFSDILKAMVKKSKYERISLDKCITWMEELLQIK